MKSRQFRAWVRLRIEGLMISFCPSFIILPFLLRPSRLIYESPSHLFLCFFYVHGTAEPLDGVPELPSVLFHIYLPWRVQTKTENYSKGLCAGCCPPPLSVLPSEQIYQSKGKSRRGNGTDELTRSSLLRRPLGPTRTDQRTQTEVQVRVTRVAMLGNGRIQRTSDF